MGSNNFYLPSYLPGNPMFSAPAMPTGSPMAPRYTPSSYRGVMSGDMLPDYGGSIPAVSNDQLAAALDTAQSAGSPSMWGSFKDSLNSSGFLSSYDTKTQVKTDGWGTAALSAAQGIGNAYMGMKQYGLFKDQLNFQKESFNKNYDAQRTTLNSQLEDRQRARVASSPGAYQSVGEYMATNRIK